MKKVWQIAATTILLGDLTIAPMTLPASCGCSTTCGVTSAHAAESQTVDLALEGLTCASCKFAVKAALKRLDGVEQVDVNYEERKATVVYDPEKVTPQQLVDAVNATGFHAELRSSADEK
ncbi:metal-binding (seleno)protein [Paucidesulfovibrio longus]|uniref:metal-binding (seleno)protein n=1 Tax=Paucidesulfovibrio longus TaxID=889 RepID=UPI00040562C9|nr:metal-binding (seleno)protein [Paucidesulfovibrio longus]